MLLWEALTLPREGADKDVSSQTDTSLVPRRLPYDKRCATITKSGKRCRGKIRSGGEHCPLHDPAMAERRRNSPAPRVSLARRRLMSLPDGYLRKLTHRAAVGEAMDRLYRELRLGIVSIEMGEVMFNILTRLLDSGLVDAGKVASRPNGRSRADRVRPKLAELLTAGERHTWRRAVAQAPVAVLRAHELPRGAAPSPKPRLPETVTGAGESPLLPLQAAS